MDHCAGTLQSAASKIGNSKPRAHTGILREENYALRQILGYCLHTLQSSSYHPPEVGQHIPGTCVKDVLLVAFDVDTGGCYEVISPDQSFHVGVSILDTRSLVGPDLTLPPKDMIMSYQFINQETKPCMRASKRFLFGETELLELPDLARRIHTLTDGRAYVLVVHGTDADTRFLNNLDPTIIGNASYLLDTVKAAQFPLQLYYRYSLEKLLGEFEIGYANLHAAGNDAHFTLKCLLMIAVRDGRAAAPTTCSGADEELFAALQAIAHTACPDPPRHQEEAPAAQAPTEKKKKLGVKAKGRLRKARKAARRAERQAGGVREREAADSSGHSREAEQGEKNEEHLIQTMSWCRLSEEETEQWKEDEDWWWEDEVWESDEEEEATEQRKEEEDWWWEDEEEEEGEDDENDKDK